LVRYTFEPAELAAIQRPLIYVIGSADPEGTVDYAKRVVAALPNAELDVLPDAGHMLWLDDAVHVGNAIRTFLDNSTSAEPRPIKQAVALDHL